MGSVIGGQHGLCGISRTGTGAEQSRCSAGVCGAGLSGGSARPRCTLTGMFGCSREASLCQLNLSVCLESGILSLPD